MSYVHENLRLYISNDAFTIVAAGEKGESLRISRTTSAVSVSATGVPPAQFDKELLIWGVYGIASLLQANYLIVITQRSSVAQLLSTPIYTATDFAVFPIERASNANLLAQPEEAYLLSLLKTHLYAAPFYFTYGPYNITTKLQAQNKGDGPFWDMGDDRFFWNRYLQSHLIDAANLSPPQDCSKFVLPVMFGFLNVKPATINGRDVLFGLVSRRSRHRAGTRYFSRGIDTEGNVSNFNETEQILLLDSQKGEGKSGGSIRGDLRFSYVQTRGSVPVYWAELNNLRYKPDLKIMDLSSTADSLGRHFEQQIALYGDQYLVNLVNKSGYEKPVKEAFEKAIEGVNNPRAHYVYFDFHHECKGLRFDRVSVLIDGMDEELHQQGYFYQDTTSSATRPEAVQSSVVRTNCMDCLDRTNVVQSALGKWVLNNQLRQAGVLSVKESIDEHPVFLDLFRNIWADNADVVSKAYSGTGALKTDYTRTGKRSKEGLLQDGVNSVVRYIKNNFLDGPRQDAYDLVTGAWIPRKGQEVRWNEDGRDLLTQWAPMVMAFAAMLILLGFLAPSGSLGSWFSSIQVRLVALVLAGLAYVVILNNGQEYVSMPKLVVRDEILAYAGKGFESGRRGRPSRKSGGSVLSRRDSVRPQTVLPTQKID